MLLAEGVFSEDESCKCEHYRVVFNSLDRGHAL